MMIELGSVPAICPMPVLMVAAYDENYKVNVMNAAWETITQMDKVLLCIDEDHKITQNILKTKAFTVSIADRRHMEVADFFGIASGNKCPDKFERSKYHSVKSAKVDAPVIMEFPVTMECELLEIVRTENLYAVIGKIVNVLANENVLDDDGKIDAEKLDPLIFDQFHWNYYSLGERAGKACQEGRSLLDG